MKKSKPLRIKTISEFHKLRGLPAPEHPLISLVEYANLKASARIDEASGLVFDFYQISIKKGIAGKFYYGQQSYDHDSGIMFFMSPNQLLKFKKEPHTDAARSGWILLIHPDFLWNTRLARSIKQCDFFSYRVNEALFLSEKEEAILETIVNTIRQEYQNNMDNFSHNIIIAHIETLINYAERFYQRQFITRRKSSHQLLSKMEALLDDYFSGGHIIKNGLPTAHYLSEQLNVSTGYLGTLLKSLTGMNTQQHIHQKLIDVAKEKLSTTTLSISEIAYELGFEHSQSFSKLFKTKTNQSPLAFRQSFYQN